jgi:hypothetical protein
MEKREYLDGYHDGQMDAERPDHPLVKANLERVINYMAENVEDVYWRGWLDGYSPLDSR